ncbi:MAG: hypothetical protein HC877_14800 [Thioploca sp.]|nr:hypothetical protein [Thioploca sp.]
MNLLEIILLQMSSVTKVLDKFLVVMLTNLRCLWGRANFRHLSRYSDYHEPTRVVIAVTSIWSNSTGLV